MVAAMRVWVKNAKGAEEVWIIPLTRLVRVRLAGSGSSKVLYLTFEGGLILQTEDPDGALLEEVSRALEANGVYAVGGLWKYTWVGE